MRLLFVMAPLLLACGGSKQHPDNNTMSVGDAPTPIAIGEAPPAVQPAPSPVPDSAPIVVVGERQLIQGGPILRVVILRALDAGLGHFLQQVRLTPALSNGKFVGHRVVEFTKRELASQGHVQVGDIVTDVNGVSVAHPDDVLTVWNSLRSAKEINIDTIRGQQARRIRFVVID